MGRVFHPPGYLTLSDMISNATMHFTMTRALRWAARQPLRWRQHARISLQLPRLIKNVRRELQRGTINSEIVQRGTLSYVQSNRRPDLGSGVYTYRIGGAPLVYASAYAALTRHLFGDLESLSAVERNAWISYLQQHQSDDGLFRDPLIACEQAEQVDWWGWRHMTLHVLMALGALGGTASKEFHSIQPFRSSGRMRQWLDGRNWKGDAAGVSNEVQNHGTMLQYARDFQGQGWCGDALDEMYDWLDRYQDARTGCWGYGNSTPWERSQGVQTGYHFWCLCFYDRRPIQYVDRIIDSCLSTQNRMGGYGVALNSSACEDIDSIDPLARLSIQTDYRRDEVLDSLRRALPWVLANRNPADGGWVFRRYQPYAIVPHKAMWAEENESFIAYTWFRSLSLAYLAQALPSASAVPCVAHFSRFPGHQFWRQGNS